MNFKIFLILFIFLQSPWVRGDSLDLMASQQEAHTFVEKKIRAYHGEKADLEITVGKIPEKARLENCEEPVEYTLEGPLTQPTLILKMSCHTPKTWSVRIPVKVQHYKQVATSIRYISKEQPISSIDCQLSRQELSLMANSFYENLEEIEGLIAQRNIPPGSVIQAPMLKQPMLVHRGEMVKMVIQAPGLTIEGSGIAQNDGIKGQVIKVKNIRSNRIVDATVIDTGITIIPM